MSLRVFLLPTLLDSLMQLEMQLILKNIQLFILCKERLSNKLGTHLTGRGSARAVNYQMLHHRIQVVQLITFGQSGHEQLQLK